MHVRSVACAAVLFIFVGCTEKQQGPERLRTVPVRGLVTLDGIPTPKLTVRLHSLEKPQGESAIYAAKPSAMTEGDGTFSISTYEQGDGVAPGTYSITLEWLTYNRMQNSYGGPDKLGGKYADPEKSQYKVTVTGDEESIELEPFHLKK
jgi:hypothetical protein